jgi:hypothetical protein
LPGYIQAKHLIGLEVAAGQEYRAEGEMPAAGKEMTE